VAAGGVDLPGVAAGLDDQVVQVGVLVDQEVDDLLGRCLDGLGAGCQDLVAGLERADTDGRSNTNGRGSSTKATDLHGQAKNSRCQR
jgi:hypothetical protein